MTLVELGRVVRLQVQQASLKMGPPKGTYYDPAPILAVDTIRFDANGATVLDADGIEIIDVHNHLHPQSKNRGENGLSFGFTAHYAQMRERFGAHLIDGIAGENVLVESSQPITLADVAGGVVLQGEDGRQVTLTEVCVAVPCAEFSRFCLDNREAPARDLTAVLQFLNDGMRGYYATADTTSPLEVRVGDRLFAIR